MRSAIVRLSVRTEEPGHERHHEEGHQGPGEGVENGDQQAIDDLAEFEAALSECR